MHGKYTTLTAETWDRVQEVQLQCGIGYLEHAESLQG
jgi:hypothetical protein